MPKLSPKELSPKGKGKGKGSPTGKGKGSPKGNGKGSPKGKGKAAKSPKRRSPATYLTGAAAILGAAGTGAYKFSPRVQTLVDRAIVAAQREHKENKVKKSQQDQLARIIEGRNAPSST